MVVVNDVKLNLAAAFPSTNSHPAHPAKFIINHEAKSVWHVRLVSGSAKAVILTDPHTFLYYGSELYNERRVGAVHLEEFLLFTLVVHDWVFFNELDCVNLLVEVDSELFDLLTIKVDSCLDNVDVEIGGEVVHVRAY